GGAAGDGRGELYAGFGKLRNSEFGRSACVVDELLRVGQECGEDAGRGKFLLVRQDYSGEKRPATAARFAENTEALRSFPGEDLGHVVAEDADCGQAFGSEAADDGFRLLGIAPGELLSRLAEFDDEPFLGGLQG